MFKRAKLMNSPHFLLAVSATLMLVGMILPFLIVIQVMESTFFLNIFSWGASVAGLAFGTIGVTEWTKRE